MYFRISFGDAAVCSLTCVLVSCYIFCKLHNILYFLAGKQSISASVVIVNIFKPGVLDGIAWNSDWQDFYINLEIIKLYDQTHISGRADFHLFSIQLLAYHSSATFISVPTGFSKEEAALCSVCECK